MASASPSRRTVHPWEVRGTTTNASGSDMLAAMRESRLVPTRSFAVVRFLLAVCVATGLLAAAASAATDSPRLVVFESFMRFT